MNTTALAEARDWAEFLQSAEFRGLGDTREAARYRVSRKTGVPESYLKRLRYKASEMSDVAGSVYKALRDAYEETCLANEKAAARYRTERLKIEEQYATAEKHAGAAGGMAAPQIREDEEA